MVLEAAKVSKLSSHAFADVDMSDLGVLVKFRIVHWEIHRLLLIQDGNQLSSRKIRLVVLDDKLVPLICLNFGNLNSIAVHSRWTV